MHMHRASEAQSVTITDLQYSLRRNGTSCPRKNPMMLSPGMPLINCFQTSVLRKAFVVRHGTRPVRPRAYMQSSNDSLNHILYTGAPRSLP
ncbi:uncharacterized protein BJ212DRAFT_899420 [Suillus subaureus]|uniref:Uncharacterized protein n=1 Tax=Suillus subaureus TaxID=48587 RepID=A0A9P7J643_9AGAM|nr:uncharacterized protein BJ212DRAFT_899420 [Suillus subaureus]KAG1804436.1 hypothetical protein BJ212DRAFT_899420 [Suillus subaureus]